MYLQLQIFSRDLLAQHRPSCYLSSQDISVNTLEDTFPAAVDHPSRNPNNKCTLTNKMVEKKLQSGHKIKCRCEKHCTFNM